ncbi:MAG: hypothetical protein NTW32_25250 [Chloroflexi bacterium]|nr:hypothetical protein [Chloroflexota bacterium]
MTRLLTYILVKGKRIKYQECLTSFVRSRNLQAIVILLLFLVTFYRDVVFYGRTFLIETGAPGTMPNAGPYHYQATSPGFVANDTGAIAWALEPFNRFASISVKKGDFPLWNPYAGLAGSPLLADGYSGTLEPLQFLFFFFPDRYWPYAVDLQLLIRFLISGFCCYIFAKRQKIDFLGSISASVVFMFSNYFVTFGNHPQIKTEALLPLVLSGYDRLADSEDRQGFWFCALFIGWAVIAAMPESTFFVLFIGTLWYFYKSIFHRMEKGKIFVRAKRNLLRHLGSTMLGALISSAYLLPFLEFVSLARSSHDPGSSGLPLPMWTLPDLLIFQTQSRYLVLGFFAIFSLIFALLHLSVWPVYRWIIVFFSTYAIIFIITIFDFPLTNWIRVLPIFDRLIFTKYPLPSINFCMAIMVGMLVDRIRYFSFSYKKIGWSFLILLTIFIGLPILGNPSKALSVYSMNNKLAPIAFGYMVGNVTYI